MTTSMQTLEFKQLRAAYLLFGLGAVACFISNDLIFVFGSVALLAGIMLAYYRRKRSTDDVYASHASWLVRTFWIGNLVAFPLAMIAHLIFLYFTTDINSLISQAASGAYGMDIQRLEGDFIAYERENIVIMLMAKWATYGLALLWWLQRCMTGYRLLQSHEAVPKITTPETVDTE